jgi:hypothetical protein
MLALPVIADRRAVRAHVQCRRKHMCGCGYMGACVCVRTCVLAHIAVVIPELA